MSQIQELHSQAMNLAELAVMTKLKGNLEQADRLIATALSGNPPQEIAEELKDLFIQINLRHYFERRGINFDEEKMKSLTLEKQLG
jgi:hypothetical protein